MGISGLDGALDRIMLSPLAGICPVEVGAPCEKARSLRDPGHQMLRKLYDHLYEKSILLQCDPILILAKFS